MFKKETMPQSYLRFFHALPIKYSIDIYIDAKLVFRSVLYEDFTDYISIFPGEHTVNITRSKNPIVIYSKTWHIPNQKIYTGIIAPKSKDVTGIELYNIEDVQRTIPSNNFLLRFGHFCMPATAIDIYLSGDAPTFKKVSCNEITNYLPLNPGIYNLQIKESNTGNSLITLPNIRLKPSRFYSIYAIGNGLKEFPLSLAIPIDGTSYLKI